jgi:hypothetical protein
MVVEHINQVELSRRWRLSPRTLERWRYRGTGPQYLKVGARILYRVADIEAFEAEQLQETRAMAPVRKALPLRLVSRQDRRARPWCHWPCRGSPGSGAPA